jgi:hypothetical protein
LVVAARTIAESLLGPGDSPENRATTELLADELRLFVGEDEAAFLLKS